MIAFLCLIYAAIVIVLFKLQILKPRPYPIAAILVGGILIIGGVVIAWFQCAPMSPRVVTTQYVIQIVPYVKGQVTAVHAQANQPVKRGDLLLEIDPAPYQYTVDQAQAQLAAAQANVEQAEAAVSSASANVVKAAAGIEQAQAAVEEAEAAIANAEAALARSKAALNNAEAGVAKAAAADELAKTEEQIALNIQKNQAGAISELKVTQAVQNREAADAALKQAQAAAGEAEAAVRQAEAGVGQAEAAVAQAEAAVAEAKSTRQQAEAAQQQAQSALKVAQSNVPAAQAQLDDARFNLAQCRVVAPADGYIVNWMVQKGTMLVPMPMAAAGTFVSTEDSFIVAAFPQNYLTNVRPNDKVELVLDPFPGKLFQARVDTVIEATGEGQYAPSGEIPSAAQIGSDGMLAVKLRLTDDNPSLHVPLGAGGTAAIYTGYGKPVHIISKVAIRMKKWLLYVLPSSK